MNPLKKLIAFLMACVMVVSMAGCFGEPVLQQNTPTEPILSVQPTAPSTAPTTVPTEPAVTPTEPAVVPTEPVVAPTEPEVVPTEPAVAPTEPEVVPTEPVVTPTEPAVVPTEPVVTPTEPVTPPTEPAPETPEILEDEREHLKEILEILDQNDEISSEVIGNMNNEELSGVITDLLENNSGTQTPETGTGAEIAPDPDAYDENGAMTTPFDQVYPEVVENGLVEYDENTLLIKMNNSQGGVITAEMAAVGVAALEAIVPMPETTWYEVKLVAGTDATAALEALRGMPEVLLAEYNYRVETAAIDHYKPFPDDKDFSGNEHHDDQWYMHHCGIPDGMGAMQTNGGSSSVIVAVIDTGVDYDHEDLAQNIWINVNEIPDNGYDDDGNGYVDDYYGVNIITGTGNGDDDNGHGTHVAGIIAAANNNLGTVGIAYNVKIMPIKAAMASGYLHQSDIAKAILYAYEHGAEVINMSFGGTSCSIAVQDALAVAYNRCVLVASAGNDGAKNEGLFAIPNYPAALTYVLGVMSVDQTGRESAFTNWDVSAFNGVEYELYAPGDSIMSTLPDNRYGILSGTSMAAPVVSAIAAILRSEFTDRDLYPTKFIYGQLCSTSDYTATCLDPELHGLHNLPQIVDLYAALTKLPNPEVNMQDSALFDTEGLPYDDAAVNNGDGVIDAGETFALGLTLRNRWGMSENTIVTIDTLSMAGIPDPYITIHNPEMNYGSVGTYSTQDCGRIYTDEIITGWENPFYITVAEDCPNDYIFRINVTITCANALNAEDTTVYTTYGTVELTVRNGYVLPSVIDEDMVLTSDSLYIIPSGTIITAGTTVRVEPGTHIQFWSDDPEDPYADNYIAYLRVDGNFFVEGTKENPVYIYPSDLMSNYNVEFGIGSGVVVLEYADITNYSHTQSNNTGGINYAYGCVFRNNGGMMRQRYLYEGSVNTTDIFTLEYGSIFEAENCVFYKISSNTGNHSHLQGRVDGCMFVECTFDLDNLSSIQNSVFLINNDLSYTQSTYETTASYTASNYLFDVQSGAVKTFYWPETGTTYFTVKTGPENDMLEVYLRELGGDFVAVETAEEAAWLRANLPAIRAEYDQWGSVTKYTVLYDLGIEYGYRQGCHVWSNGTAVETITLPDSDPVNRSTPYYNSGVLFFSYEHPGHDSNCWNHEYWRVYEIPGPIYVTDIQLREYEVMLDPGSSYRIQTITQPVPVPVDQLIFESMDETVATVDENGVITPVGMGTTDVYVYCDDRAVCNYITVTVTEYMPLEQILPVGIYTELAVGAYYDATWQVLPEDTTRRMLRYTSSDETVATVDIYGNVTGVGSGTAVITALSDGTDADGNPIQASILVTVYQPVESLVLEQETAFVQFDDGTMALPNVTYTEGGEPALSWRSLDETVAEIVDGVLVLKKAGTTTLEVTDLRTGLTDSCLVWVLEEELPAIREMASYQGYTFALLEDGRLFHWGGDASKKTPKCYLTDVTDMVVDSDYVTVLLASGAVEKWYYWGSSFSQGYTYTLSETWEVAGIAGYGYRNCIVWLADGTVYAQGTENSCGQLGVGTTESVYGFTFVNLAGVVSVVTTSNATYFLTEDGKLYLAGSYSYYTTPMLIAENIAELYSTVPGNVTVVTADGTVGAVSGENVSLYDAVNMDVVSWCGTEGLGIRDGRVYRLTFDSMNIQMQETLVHGISNAVNVFCMSGTYFIQTQDNLLYGFGNNSSHQMGTSSTEYAEAPVLIPLVQPEGDALTLVQTNVVDGELTDGKLILSFNKELLSAVVKLYADGTQTTFSQEITDLNKLAISKSGGFEIGTTYTLVLSVGAVHALPALTNAEEITVTFTYGYKGQYVVDIENDFSEPYGAYALDNLGNLYYFERTDMTVGNVELVLRNVKSFDMNGTEVYVLLNDGTIVYMDRDTGTMEIDRNFVGQDAVEIRFFSGPIDGNGVFVLLKNGTSYANETVGHTNCNAYGQLGVGVAGAVTGWMKVLVDEPIAQIQPASDITYILTEDGRLYVAGGENLSVATPVLLCEDVTYLGWHGLFVSGGYFSYFDYMSDSLEDMVMTNYECLAEMVPGEDIGIMDTAVYQYNFGWSEVDGVREYLVDQTTLCFLDDLLRVCEVTAVDRMPEIACYVAVDSGIVYAVDDEGNETFLFALYNLNFDGEIQDEVSKNEAIWDESVERFYWTPAIFAETLNTMHSELNWNETFLNNAILNQISTDTDVTHWLRILGSDTFIGQIPFGGNYWGTTNERAIGLQIVDYSDFPNYAQVGYKTFLTEAPENTFPFVVDVTVLNKEGEEVFTVGNEEITVRVTFNRDMDTSVRLTVRFGSYYPYGDYEIPGEFVDARTWEGTYTLNTLIENGYQYFSIFNGRTADGELDLYNDHGRFLFEIDTTAAQALIMQGYAEDTGIQLSWTQDDFDTLMGYNVYRSTSEDGYYQRVNTSVIPAETREFFDDTVEPGVVYYYNFTVVKTDLTESVPSGKISIMSKDTMAPNIYHSPVYVANTGSNLIISATVTDNLTISTAYVYYRTVGETSWKVAVMNKLNDKYSAIIPAAELTTAGVEYYIEAFDGISYTYKGTADAPYRVTVQQTVDANSLGDVNGDGRVSNLDALMLLQAINDLLNLDAEQFARADLNGDGVLTAAEALRILQYVSGTVGDLIMP